MTQKLIPFMLPNGVQAAIKPVAQELFYDISEANPPPAPPMEAVERPNGEVELKPNPSHPDHIKAVAEHNSKMTLKLRDFLIKQALVLRLNEEQKADVDALREAAAEMGVTLPADDKLVYYTRIACGSMAETREIIVKVQEAWGVTSPKSNAGSGDSTPASEAQS